MNEIKKLLAIIELMEAVTFRSQAQAIIAAGRAYVTAAAAKLQHSRFSPSARLEFRARVSGMIRRNAQAIANLGWQAGGGESGKYPRADVSRYVETQQRYLSKWFIQIRDEQRLVGGAGRAKMYADSLMGLYNEMWNLGKHDDTDMPKLPAVPGDGSTLCLINCHCHWEIERYSEGWHAYWRLSPVENCDTCHCRAKHWNPLTIRAVGGGWVTEISNAPATCDLYAYGTGPV